MTDRPRLDQLTDDKLDQLYARAEQAEATIERVRAVADGWAQTATRYPDSRLPTQAAAFTIHTALDGTT